MSAPPRPSIYNLQRFLLGTLPPDEASQVAAWVESSPDAPTALAGVAAHDALTKAVTSTVGVTAPPAPAVERVVRNVTTGPPIAARTGPPPPPDVAQQTQPAGTPHPASTGDWRPQSGTAPARFGPFRVVRELGRGGMGVVYEAVDESLGRYAAVKVLSPDLAANDEARRRFLREGSAAADLKSDHVVTIYQVGEEAGVPFLAMEFIEGSPLEQWLQTRSAPVTADEVLWVARDLLAGLAAAHKKGRIHRDIKPANAMVERDTHRVKILDFGLTRAVDGAEQLTRANAVLGTPEYMSPEQARGEKLDARTDLFSVGVVLYRVVLGRSPFRRDGIMPTLYAVVNEPPPALTGLPPELSAFVARLMSPKREDRPADAGAALAELREIEARLSIPLEREPVPVQPAHPSEPAGHRVQRQFQFGCVVTIAFCLLVVSVVLTVRDRSGGETAGTGTPDSEPPPVLGIPGPAPKDEDKRTKAAEQEVKDWLRKPPAVASVADAGRAMHDAELLIKRYSEEKFADRTKATQLRVRARLLVIESLAPVADAQYQTATKAKLPLNPGNNEVKAAVETLRGLEEQMAALSREVKGADEDKIKLDPTVSESVDAKATVAIQCASRMELLTLFAQEDLISNPGGATAWLMQVAAQYKRTQDAAIREQIRRKVQEFCEAFVPKAASLDDKLLIRNKEVLRASVTVKYMEGSVTKSALLSDRVAGLNEFNVAELHSGESTIYVSAGAEELPKDVRPTELSKVAVLFTTARAQVGDGIAGPKWTAKSVDELKKKCDAQTELVNRLKAPGTAGGELMIGTRLASLADGLKSAADLIESAP